MKVSKNDINCLCISLTITLMPTICIELKSCFPSIHLNVLQCCISAEAKRIRVANCIWSDSIHVQSIFQHYCNLHNIKMAIEKPENDNVFWEYVSPSLLLRDTLCVHKFQNLLRYNFIVYNVYILYIVHL